MPCELEVPQTPVGMLQLGTPVTFPGTKFLALAHLDLDGIFSASKNLSREQAERTTQAVHNRQLRRARSNQVERLIRMLPHPQRAAILQAVTLPVDTRPNHHRPNRHRPGQHRANRHRPNHCRLHRQQPRPDNRTLAAETETRFRHAPLYGDVLEAQRCPGRPCLPKRPSHAQAPRLLCLRCQRHPTRERIPSPQQRKPAQSHDARRRRVICAPRMEYEFQGAPVHDGTKSCSSPPQPSASCDWRRWYYHRLLSGYRSITQA
jgi:hypothetical protein